MKTNETNSRELLESIAYERGLYYITTVEKGGNGYPRGMAGAIIGFENYDEAAALAREHNLNIMQLHKRAGWQMYERQDVVFEPLKPTAEWYGDDYHFFREDDREDYFENEVSPFLEGFSSFDGVQTFLNDQREIYDQLQTIDESRVVVTCIGRYYETIDRESMAWAFDSNEYVIGVVQL